MDARDAPYVERPMPTRSATPLLDVRVFRTKLIDQRIGDDVAARRKRFESVSRCRLANRRRGRACERLAHQLGNDFARGLVLTPRSFLGGIQHVIGKVESRPHASDDAALII